MFNQPESGNPALSVEEQNLLHQRLQVLDPDQNGVTLDKLRVFYPKAAWSPIIEALRALQAEGRLNTAMRGAPVQFEYYIWQ